MENEENINLLPEATLTEGHALITQTPLLSRILLIVAAMTVFSMIVGIILLATLLPQLRGPSDYTYCRPPPSRDHVQKIVYKQRTPVLITHATIFDGVGNVFYDFDILIEKGRISRMQPHGEIRSTEGMDVYNVNGRIVTPGLIDLHSHLGIHSYPQMQAYQDYNEKTNPAAPYLRVVDALRPNDHAIPDIVSGGVTTSLVLPGSCKCL